MRILLVTNLYPPQELGGYGRCMADFTWGLQQRGHHIQVLCSDATYLGRGGNGPSNEPVSRCLQLKGSFAGGVSLERNLEVCQRIDQHNQHTLQTWLTAESWDGVLLGNIDLLGAELLPTLVASGLPVLHHVGFVAPPYPPEQRPRSRNYRLVAASETVRQSLVEARLPLDQAAVVYPGARVELFGAAATGRALPPPMDGALGPLLGSPANPLKVCFAGLLMGSKGAHTLVEALISLHQRGIALQANLAGDTFQAGYRHQLETLLAQAGMDGMVRITGKLSRPQLARFFSLHHVCVFPSIYPEAFGIVGAEAMASGLVLVSSGVGGASELIEHGVSGLRFTPGDRSSLASQLEQLVQQPHLTQRLSQAGQRRARNLFSVERAAQQLEQLFETTDEQAVAMF